MKREKIIEEISDFLVVYLKAGKVGLNSFIKKTELNISQLDHLLMIHFLLQDEVKQFVRDLPVRIRRFKTSTRLETETYVGEVRGQINWPNTLKERLKINYKDRTIFSCNESIRNYDIPENLVLKELLQLLYRMLYLKIDFSHIEKYEYFREWKDLKVIVDEMLRKNVYLSKVQVTDHKVTDRIIQNTLLHRNPLYRGAAKLLLNYRELIKKNDNQEILKELLKETFIFPEKEDVLFELFWTIQLIKNSTEDAQLQLIDGRNNLVASWEDESYCYHIYHDSTGSENLMFHISTDEVAKVEHPYISKRIKSMERALQVAQTSFQSNFNTTTFWSGRPDIIVEVYCKGSGELVKVLIGEVKDTIKTDYAVKGLRELVDYMELAKDKNGVYLKEEKVEGRLFVGDMDIPNTEAGQIKIHSLSNWQDRQLNISLNEVPYH